MSRTVSFAFRCLYETAVSADPNLKQGVVTLILLLARLYVLVTISRYFWRAKTLFMDNSSNWWLATAPHRLYLSSKECSAIHARLHLVYLAVSSGIWFSHWRHFNAFIITLSITINPIKYVQLLTGLFALLCLLVLIHFVCLQEMLQRVGAVRGLSEVVLALAELPFDVPGPTQMKVSLVCTRIYSIYHIYLSVYIANFPCCKSQIWCLSICLEFNSRMCFHLVRRCGHVIRTELPIDLDSFPSGGGVYEHY